MMIVIVMKKKTYDEGNVIFFLPVHAAVLCYCYAYSKTL